MNETKTYLQKTAIGYNCEKQSNFKELVLCL